jgi:hypothetical protein
MTAGAEGMRHSIFLPMKLAGLIDRPEKMAASDVVRWWEIHRIAFNLIVGATGIATCLIAVISGLIVESAGGVALFPNPPLFAAVGVILYGIMANVAYTAGWIFELIARKLWPAEASAFGRLSFIFGIVGSVFLTLAPAALIVLGSCAELIAHSLRSH